MSKELRLNSLIQKTWEIHFEINSPDVCKHLNTWVMVITMHIIFPIGHQWYLIDPSVSAALKCKWANQSVAFASSDRGLTTVRLCSVETQAIFSDFRLFQAGSVDFELIVFKRWVWGTFKSDVCYSTSFEEISNVKVWAELFARPHSPLNRSQFNKHS